VLSHWLLFRVRPYLCLDLRQLRFHSLVVRYSIYLNYWPMFTSVTFHTLEASEIFTAL